MGGSHIDGNLLGQMLKKRIRLLTTTLRTRTSYVRPQTYVFIISVIVNKQLILVSNTPFPNCIIMTSLEILELFLRHSKNITEFSKNNSLKTQILRKKSCFDQIL